MLNNPEFISVWKEFKEMRKAKKKPLTKNAENRQLTKVNKLYNLLDQDMNKLIQHLEVVCNSCWENVYRDDEHLNKIVNNLTIDKNESKSTFTKSKFQFNKESEYHNVAEQLQSIIIGYNFVGEITGRQ
tara:strand:- start:4133 stop:4519 length:387 start_codon:yes stop_codon:yes gene_type:complete